MGQTIPSKLNMLSSIFLASAVAITTASPIRLQQQSMVIATFDGSSTRQWQDTNDPVMGGQSTSTFKVSNNTGVFDGHARIVPSLKAPGFCKVTGVDVSVDISAYVGGSITIMARSTTPEYMGYRLGFAGHNIPKTSIFGGGSYKAGFNVTSMEMQNITIPMHRFSYDWSGFTGRCDTKDPSKGILPGQQHYCCDSEPQKDKVCPQPKYLNDITGLELWAEGVAGVFHLEVASISVNM